MKNKTLANWMILSFVLCVLGTWDEVFYTLGGTGLLVFSIWYIVKMQKQANWIYYGYIASFVAFMIGVFTSLNTSIFSWIFWVFAIIAVVNLYKLDGKEKLGNI